MFLYDFVYCLIVGIFLLVVAFQTFTDDITDWTAIRCNGFAVPIHAACVAACVSGAALVFTGLAGVVARSGVRAVSAII